MFITHIPMIGNNVIIQLTIYLINDYLFSNSMYAHENGMVSVEVIIKNIYKTVPLVTDQTINLG